MRLTLVKGLVKYGMAASIFIMAGNYTAFGADNVTLSAISIEGADNTFTVTLKTSKDTQVLSRVSSPDRMVLELDNTKASELIKTTFRNAGNIDDVIVQPLKNNKTRILLSGANIAKSKVIIDSSQTVAMQENINEQPSLDSNAGNNNIENLAANNATMTSKEFLEQNSNQINTNTTPQEPADTAIIPEESVNYAETTGATSTVNTEAEPSLEDSNIDSEAIADQNTSDSEMFKPAADLGINDTHDKTTINNQESAAAATAKSLAAAQGNDLLSTPWLLRFGIVFVFVTVLVAYLRKEKLLSFRPKAKKQVLNTEHLDIYRSLHNSTNVGPPYNKTASRSKAAPATMSRQTYRPNTSTNTRTAANNLNKYSAMSGYKKQNSSAGKATYSNLTKNSGLNPAINTIKKSTVTKASNKSVQTDNVAFLKSMADIYEKSGRHDLAVSIQNKIRKTVAKA